MGERIFITDTPRALRDHGVICSYHQIWQGVVAGNIPALRRGKRWTIDKADLPAIADMLTASA